MKLKSIAVSFFLSMLLLGCGGGGGGSGDAPSPSPSPLPAAGDTYQVWRAWVNSVDEAASRSFAGEGIVNGLRVTASGSQATAPLENGTFEGRSALAKTTALAGTITVEGQTFPLTGLATFFYDANYLPLGIVNDEYVVVTGTPSFPQTAKAGDTGVLYTYGRYPSSAKASSLGSGTVSYELAADTAPAAILKLITVENLPDGSLESTTIRTARIAPDGTWTPLAEEYRSGSNVMTTRYLAVL